MAGKFFMAGQAIWSNLSKSLRLMAQLFTHLGITQKDSHKYMLVGEYTMKSKKKM